MSDNEYADMKAAAYAARPDEIKATANLLSIAIYLSSRKCLYEIGNEYAVGRRPLVLSFDEMAHGQVDDVAFAEF